MVDVDSSSHSSADSQTKSVSFVRGLAITRRSVCIHQITGFRNGYGHDDSTINTTLVSLLLEIKLSVSLGRLQVHPVFTGDFVLSQVSSLTMMRLGEFH